MKGVKVTPESGVLMDSNQWKTLRCIAVITVASCENGIRNELKTSLIIYVKQIMKELQYKDNVCYRAILFSMLS